MNCDYCGQPGIQLAGETNDVVVCIDHVSKPRARAALRVIQKTADKQGNVTMLRLAENIANDATLVRLAQAEGWDAAVREAEDCGLLAGPFAAEVRGRNPYRGGVA